MERGPPYVRARGFSLFVAIRSPPQNFGTAATSNRREEISNHETDTDFSAVAVGCCGSRARQETYDSARAVAGGTAIDAYVRGMVCALEYRRQGVDGRAGKLERWQRESLGRPTHLSPGVLESAEPRHAQRGESGKVQRKQRRDLRQI